MAVTNKIVENIVYAKAKIKNNFKEHFVLIFGLLSILPKYQNRGIRSK